MAKILNYQNYHKVLVAEHRHHHQRHHQQQLQLQQLQHQQQHYDEQPPFNNKQRQQALENSKNQCKNLKVTAVSNSYTSKQTHTHQQHVAKVREHVSSAPQRHKQDLQQDSQEAAYVSGHTLQEIPQRPHVISQPVQQNLLHQQHVARHGQHPYLNDFTQLTSSSPAHKGNRINHCRYHHNNRPSPLPGSYTSPLQCIASSSASSASSLSSSASGSTNTITSTTYSTYTTCCVLTYNLVAAYAEAATLQLKRKTSFNKLLHVGGRRHATDIRSICYLILMAFVYWGVMIRAAVATNVTASSSVTTKATMPSALVAELSSNVSINTGAHIVAIGHGHRGGGGGGGSVGVSSGMNDSNSSSNERRRLQQPFPISSVSSDVLTNYQRRLLMRREAANVPDFEDDDSSYHDDEFDEYETLIRNKSAKGKYIGAPCYNMTCEATLLHVTCDKETLTCGCEKNYPVQLGLTRGCDKPKKLGEQCFYDETCQYNDENSLCVQVRHNAMCQCANGFHSVSYTKPTRKVFCTQDLDELNSDLPTLLGVCVGIGVLAGLICMVLHLFSKTKYPRHRNFGDANLPPPIMYSSETGIPLTVQSGRPSSRSSIRSSGGSIGSYGNRRSSTGAVNATGGSKGILVSTSRTGSRRPSLASVHSTSSSVRSYSMMRFEKEQQQKEIRQEMKLRLARLQQHQHQQHLGQYKPQIIIGDTALSMQHGVALSRITMATPSPMTPNSTDELLPSVDENQEYPPKIQQPIPKSCTETVASATLSAIKNAAVSTGTNPKLTSTSSPASANAAAVAANITTDMANAAAYIGPCSSSSEAL